MEIFHDGWSVWIENSRALIMLILTILGLGTWGGDVFLRAKKSDLLTRWLISLNLGTLILFWLTVPLVCLGQFLPSGLMPGGLILTAGSAIYLAWKFCVWLGEGRDLPTFLWILGGGACFFLYLLIRLAFLSDLILPPYDDSPEHFVIIRDLLNGDFARGSSFYSLAGLTGHYYHFGFHILATWLTASAGSNPASIMGLLGQFFIAFSSLSIMLFVIETTGSIPGGLFAAALTAFAWKMPAFAANWGKYPAITGFALLPGWLVLIYYLTAASKTKVIALFSFFAAVAGLGLIHTRLLLCLPLAGLGWMIGRTLPKRLGQPRILMGAGLFMLLFTFTLFSRQLALFYSGTSYLPLILILLLFPFAVRSFPGAVIGILAVMMGIWVAFKTPVRIVEGYGANWLDAPFVEMSLFIPLTLLAGLGVAGLGKFIHVEVRLKQVVMIAIALLVVAVNFSSHTSYYPDECCNFVSDEDVNAINWLAEQTPEDAVIWTAGFKPRNYMIGTDAGIWVSAFTGRNVNKLDYDFEWDAPSARSRICQAGYGDVYIYRGDRQFSFNDQKLASTTWAKLVFTKGNTKIYTLDCSP